MAIVRRAGRRPTGRRRAPRLAPEIRRKRLLEAATRVFAREGVTMACHPDVAREAKVSLSTVFLYFPTRAALREAVFAELERWAFELADAAHGTGLAPREALYEHLRRTAELLQGNPDFVRIWLSWSMAIEDDLWPRYLELQRRIVEIISTTVRRGQAEGSIRADLEPDDGALALIGGAYMIAQTHAAGRSPAELERFARDLVRSVFHAGASVRAAREADTGS